MGDTRSEPRHKSLKSERQLSMPYPPSLDHDAIKAYDGKKEKPKRSSLFLTKSRSPRHRNTVSLHGMPSPISSVLTAGDGTESLMDSLLDKQKAGALTEVVDDLVWVTEVKMPQPTHKAGKSHKRNFSTASKLSHGSSYGAAPPSPMALSKIKSDFVTTDSGTSISSQASKYGSTVSEFESTNQTSPREHAHQRTSSKRMPVNHRITPSVFHMEKKIAGGTAEALIRVLIQGKQYDPAFANTLFATYRIHTTPVALVHGLVHCMPDPPARLDLEDVDVEALQQYRDLQKRFVNIVALWTQRHAGDWADDTNGERIDLLRRGIVRVTPRPEDMLLRRQLMDYTSKILMAAKSREREQREMETNDGQEVQPNETTKTGHCKKQMVNMRDFSARRCAEQFLLIELDIFCDIKVHELLGCAWMKDTKQTHSPHIVHSIDVFNRTAKLVMHEVLFAFQADKELTSVIRAEMVQTVEFLIEVAQECINLKNIATAKAIISGLGATPIHRLTAMWAAVSFERKKEYDTMRELLSEGNNKAQLRSFQRKTPPPLVPYLGLYLNDLAMVDCAHEDLITAEQMPDVVEKMSQRETPIINFEKCRRIWGILHEVMYYQSAEVRSLGKLYQKVQKFCDWFDDLELLSEEEYYQLSLVAQPRQAATAKLLGQFMPQGRDTPTDVVKPMNNRRRGSHSRALRNSDGEPVPGINMTAASNTSLVSATEKVRLTELLSKRPQDLGEFINKHGTKVLHVNSNNRDLLNHDDPVSASKSLNPKSGEQKLRHATSSMSISEERQRRAIKVRMLGNGIPIVKAMLVQRSSTVDDVISEIVRLKYGPWTDADELLKTHCLMRSIDGDQYTMVERMSLDETLVANQQHSSVESALNVKLSNGDVSKDKDNKRTKDKDKEKHTHRRNGSLTADAGNPTGGVLQSSLSNHYFLLWPLDDEGHPMDHIRVRSYALTSAALVQFTFYCLPETPTQTLASLILGSIGMPAMRSSCTLYYETSSGLRPVEAEQLPRASDVLELSCGPDSRSGSKLNLHDPDAKEDDRRPATRPAQAQISFHIVPVDTKQSEKSTLAAGARDVSDPAPLSRTAKSCTGPEDLLAAVGATNGDDVSPSPCPGLTGLETDDSGFERSSIENGQCASGAHSHCSNPEGSVVDGTAGSDLLMAESSSENVTDDAGLQHVRSCSANADYEHPHEWRLSGGKDDLPSPPAEGKKKKPPRHQLSQSMNFTAESETKGRPSSAGAKVRDLLRAVRRKGGSNGKDKSPEL
eukprot:Clim_evm28s66 gene=Clim_evmTU28s66